MRCQSSLDILLLPGKTNKVGCYMFDKGCQYIQSILPISSLNN